MIIYKDICSGDEIISDTYDLKEVDDVVYEVDCKMITKGPVEVNTGAQQSVGGYGGESAGGDDDDAPDGPVEDAPVQVNDVIDGFRLNQMPPHEDKQAFAKEFKLYTKRLQEKLKENGVSEEERNSINDKMKKYAPKLAKKITDFEPYIGESFDMENAIPCYLNYRENDKGEEVPYFTIWKHALTEMKV